MATCSNPGCDQPGTNQCSACKTTPYCGSICQTADWAHHKEECPGHLRKVGMANLAKAEGFHRVQNYPQSLRHAELAANKLKQLKEHPVEDIDSALRIKYNALNFMDRNKETLECAKEWYCMYPTNHTHPPAIQASFCLIESCILNKEFFDAALYARTLWETITLSRDSHIPDHQLQEFTARGAYELARALWQLAVHGGMPPEERQETGKEAIMLARRALEIYTQLFGTESELAAAGMGTLASVLHCFNGIDDDDVIRLLEQSIAIYVRVEGRLSFNVAAGENNLSAALEARANGARDANDLNRCVANLELALPRLREAARIFRAINMVERADKAAQEVAKLEEKLRRQAAKITAASRV